MDSKKSAQPRASDTAEGAPKQVPDEAPATPRPAANKEGGKQAANESATASRSGSLSDRMQAVAEKARERGAEFVERDGDTGVDEATSTPAAQATPEAVVGTEETKSMDAKPVETKAAETSGVAQASTKSSAKPGARKATTGETGSSAVPAAPGDTAASAVSKARTRKARLVLTRIDPWTTMKTSFLLSIAFGVVTIIAVFVIWTVLGAAGTWDSINQAVQTVVGEEEASNFLVEDYVGTARVLGFTILVAIFDVILITAIATLTAFLYNMGAALLGGVELTLTENRR